MQILTEPKKNLCKQNATVTFLKFNILSKMLIKTMIPISLESQKLHSSAI